MSTNGGSNFQFSDVFVLAGGMVTTAATLGAVYWLAYAQDGFEIMGWYVLFIVPAGAIAAGAAAGSGYGLVSWLNGRKVGGSLLVALLLFQVAAYSAAQWIEFRSLHLVYETGRPVSFVDYFDLTTRSMVFSLRDARAATGQLGVFGYIFRFLELAGFALGGLAIPHLLRSKPYCEHCRRYMRTRSIGLLPAAIPVRKVKRKDLEGKKAYEEEAARALEAGLAEAGSLVEAAGNQDATTVRGILEKHAGDRKRIKKLMHRIEVTLSACARCHDGLIACKMMSGQGKKLVTKQLASHAVTAGLAGAIR